MYLRRRSCFSDAHGPTSPTIRPSSGSSLTVFLTTRVLPQEGIPHRHRLRVNAQALSRGLNLSLAALSSGHGPAAAASLRRAEMSCASKHLGPDATARHRQGWTVAVGSGGASQGANRSALTRTACASEPPCPRAVLSACCRADNARRFGSSHSEAEAA